jgi:hypothetical protein
MIYGGGEWKGRSLILHVCVLKNVFSIYLSINPLIFPGKFLSLVRGFEEVGHRP